jgi:hypothetical protein
MQTFNLRRTNASKTDGSSQSTANSNVVAILEKANAIRQVSIVLISLHSIFCATLLFPHDLFHVIRLWPVTRVAMMIHGVIYDHLTADVHCSLFLYIQAITR